VLFDIKNLSPSYLVTGWFIWSLDLLFLAVSDPTTSLPHSFCFIRSQRKILMRRKPQR